MLASIVIPVYNSEKFIAQSVNSVLCQTFSEFELLLVNDGSTDDTGKILNELSHQDERIKIISKINGGASSARNAGFSKAEGDYIVFIDSDDTVSPNYIKDLVDGLYNNMADIVVHGFQVFDGNKETKKVAPYKNELISIESKRIFEEIPLLCLSSPISKLFKKSIIRESNLSFDESINIGEDLVFVMDYISQCKNISISSTSNYVYERRSGSLSTSFHSFDEEILADQLINKSCKAMYEKFNYDYSTIIDSIETALSKHGYRIIFALYNKGKMKYTRKDRIQKFKAVEEFQVERIQRYFKKSGIKGKLLAFLLHKKRITITDYFLSYFISRKKI
jgi:glycosyltransferase involved in cell wall biosynthesis